MPRIKRKLTARDVARYFQEYLKRKSIADQMSTEVGDMKATLMSYVEEAGEPDDKGHVWVELPTTVEGFNALKRERRASEFIDEEIAEAELRKLGLWEKCQKQITVLDDDVLYGLAYEGKIPKSIMAKIIQTRESWAFKPGKL